MIVSQSDFTELEDFSVVGHPNGDTILICKQGCVWGQQFTKSTGLGELVIAASSHIRKAH